MKNVIISASIKIIDGKAILTMQSDKPEILVKTIEDHLNDTWDFIENIGDINIWSDEFIDAKYLTKVAVYPNSIDGTHYLVPLIDTNQEDLNHYTLHYKLAK